MLKARASTLPINMNHDVSSRSNQSLPRNTLPGRSGPRLGGQHSLLSLIDNRSSQQKAQENHDFYTKSMPPPKKETARPQSAMAQLYTESLSLKQDSLTAKVRPILSKSVATSVPAEVSRSRSSTASPSTNYYSLNTKDKRPGSPVVSPSSGTTNLFAYRQPPPVQTKVNSPLIKSPSETVLPNENSKYLHPPPPYPSAEATPASNNNALNPGSETRDSISERSFTVDIEALRRKFAHAPRPLKKRSSFSEPERPQGPVIPKLIYDQIYKKADTPFYRPQQEEQDRRLTPPPAYVAPEKVAGSTAVDKNNEKVMPRIPNESVSYERNVTPTQFMRQQNQVQGRFKPNKQPTCFSPPPMTGSFDDRKNQLSPKVASPQLPTSPASPLPPMPSLYARPTHGILR